jgi:hypothetical protein
MSDTDTQIEENIDEILNNSEEASADKREEKPTPDEEKTTNNVMDDIETAVLLVVNSSGNVLPVVQIENLKMNRIASPREVYRICLDAADQLSSVSLLGEMTNIFSALQKEGSKYTAQQMASLLLAAQKTKGDSRE